MVSVAAFTLYLAGTARAEAAATDANAIAAGHSLIGHVFDDGPRQRAYLMPGMPKVHFPISCRGPQAQEFFDQGIGQVHGFWFFEAERSFRQVTAADKNCAIAYWGMAMANMSNDPRAHNFIAKAMGLRDRADKRERRWIEALAAFYEVKADEAAAAAKLDPSALKPSAASAPKYSRSSLDRYKGLIESMENVVEEYPDDIEAKAFLVFHIWDASAKWSRYFDADMGKGLLIPSPAAVDALARQVLAKNPMHPIHHYLIHLWDGPRARRALPSAFRSGQSSPGIAHMWHMAGHTLTKLERYEDAAYQQEASARVDHAYMMRDNVFPDQIHNYGHNNAWLVETLATVGRVRDALGLARNLVDIPRHPRWNAVASPDEKGSAYATANDKRENSAAFGRVRLFQILVEYELWDDLVRLRDTPYLDGTTDPEMQASRAHALGLAYLNTGRRADGAAASSTLELVLARQKEERARAFDEAFRKARLEKLADDKAMKAVAEAVAEPEAAIKKTEALMMELVIVAKVGGGANGASVSAAEWDSLKSLPKTRLSRLYFTAGQRDRGLALAREAADAARNQVGPLANLADLQAHAGKQTEALATWKKLRPLCSRVDLDVPLFARLTPLATKAGTPRGTDWRPPYTTAPDVDVPRPALDTLGSLYWSPPPAPDFTLPDSNGKALSLKQYRGKPVVAIFYLGAGCVHCLEQLTLFAPAAKKFAAAGISLVAISVDSVAGLKKTFEAVEARTQITFPVLSDQGLAAFKAFRAFDDFEKLPLHGTFLIDGEGLIRWHDINYEPFAQVDFLLEESRRLLRTAPRQQPGPGRRAPVAQGN